MKRIGAWFLLASLLLCILPSPAFGAETGLSGAQLTLSREVYAYDGSSHEPDVTVVLDGQRLQRDVDFTVDYSDNCRAGTASATVTGIGAYFGSRTQTFTILPRTLTEKDLTFSVPVLKSYDGTREAVPEAEARVLSGDQVTVTCAGVYDDPYAGAAKALSVTAVSLSGQDSGNYALDLSYPLRLYTGQITMALPKVTAQAEVAVGRTLDLNTLVSVGGASFRLSGESRGSVLSDAGLLTAGSAPETLQISVVLDSRDLNGDGAPEYAPARETITVRVVERQSQDPVTVTPTTPAVPDGPAATSGSQQSALTLPGSASVTYGQTLALNVSGGSGTGKVVYTVKPISGDAFVDSQGVLTPKKVGTVWVTAQKLGDGTYAAGTPVSVEVTIRPAQLTVSVGNRTARVGDPVPVLTDADYTISGLADGDILAAYPTLAYDPQPDLSQPGSVAIRASGARPPQNGNYSQDVRYLDGTLTIRSTPVYPVTLAPCEHGTLTADRLTAAQEDRITLRTRSEKGYSCQSLTVRDELGQAVTVAKQDEGLYTFLMPAASVTVTARFAKAEARLPFQDVSPADWFYESVDWAWRSGLMKGTAETQFSPNQTTSRGMIVTLLYRLAGSPEAPKWSPFGDVAEGAYYAAPVAWAAWNGIVNGYSQTKFGPNDPISREQFAAILYRYAQHRTLDVSAAGSLASFADAGQVHDYAKTPMAWAAAAGLITGKSGSVLDPRGPASRAQAAAILQRFVQRYP